MVQVFSLYIDPFASGTTFFHFLFAISFTLFGMSHQAFHSLIKNGIVAQSVASLDVFVVNQRMPSR